MSVNTPDTTILPPALKAEQRPKTSVMIPFVPQVLVNQVPDENWLEERVGAQCAVAKPFPEELSQRAAEQGRYRRSKAGLPAIDDFPR